MIVKEIVLIAVLLSIMEILIALDILWIAS